ncbi:MAG: type II secretion system F family protein [Patescibacteria group bacterium]
MPEKESPQTLAARANAWVERHLGRVPFVQKFMFIHHLEIMSKAGLSIINSLQVLAAEIENKKLKHIVGEIKAEVETGKQLSEVLAKYPNVFPHIYVNMVAAGEISGKLDDALGQISDQMQKSQRLNAKVRGAMIYPCVIMVAMVGIALFVVFYIMPKILVMFTEMDAKLPLATRILIAITHFGQNYWWAIFIAIAAAIFGYSRALRIPKFKHTIHNLILSLPIFGIIVIKVNLARFTLTLSSLLSSTIPIVDAVRISSEVLNNVVYREQLAVATEGLKQGQALSQILSAYKKTFPPMVTEMVMVGEQTGRIEKMLKELSEYYNNEVEETMNNFTAIIEPVIILMLGVGTAGIAIAVIMPMYSLAQSV